MTEVDSSGPGATAKVGDLIALARRQAWRIGLAALFMGVGALSTAAYAFLVGPVLAALYGADAPPTPSPATADFLDEIGRALISADPVVIPLAILAVAAAKGLSFFAQRAFTIAAGQRVLADLRSRMYRGLLALNPIAPPPPSSGELVSRFTVDAGTVEAAISLGLLGALGDALQLLALAALAFRLDPVLGLIGLVAFPPAALVISRLGRLLRRRKREEHDASGAMGDAVDETGAGLLVIGAFDARGMMEERFERRNRTLMGKAGSALLVKAFSSPLNEILGAAALGAAIWYSHARIRDGLLAPDELVSFFTALVLLYRPVKGLGQAQHAVQSGLAALDRLARFAVKASAEPAPVIAAKDRRQGVPRLELRDVAARYGDGPDVLAGLTLTLEPGERLAVVGSSGGGKTTLLRLLLGLLPARRGSILVDGEPVSDRGAQKTALLFAPVPQEPFLFDGDIATNVRCGRPEATAAEVEAACRAAGVMDFALAMEGGLEAEVGHRGARLSVGQRQRVCLARALLSDAPVLLLDETTAMVDGETERGLVAGLDEHLRGRSVIVVTHRRSTALWSDRIALLEAGAVGVTGDPLELLDGHPSVVKLFGGRDRAQRGD